MTVYIYGLKCPHSGQVRYIGKSTKPSVRLYGHLGAAVRGEYNHHTARWLRKLIAAGARPELVILHTVAEGERWQDAERAAIAAALESGNKLTNATAGGEGLDYINQEDDARYRRNLSRSLKALWNTPERKKEASQRSLRAWADPAVTARRLASMVAAQNKPDVKARIAVAMAEVNARPSVKATRSRKSKRNWQDENYRAVIIAARNDPTFAEQQGARLKSRWRDDGHRTKMQEARWPEDKRREQAERLKNPECAEKIKRALSDPETIRRRNAAIKASWARRKATAMLNRSSFNETDGTSSMRARAIKVDRGAIARGDCAG